MFAVYKLNPASVLTKESSFPTTFLTKLGLEKYAYLFQFTNPHVYVPLK